MTKHYDIRDDFAGPGGWDEGLRLALRAAGLPVKTMIGVEFDKAACDTAVAAGHERLCADVKTLRDADITFDAYIASPPCQTFSAAGKGKGREALAHLVEAATLVGLDNLTPEEAVERVADEALDERSVLVLEPLYVIATDRPRWVALEQVPAVLPVWEAYVAILADLGYSARAEVLNSEQYGVPQTRRRAILVAVRDDVMAEHGLTEVPWPTATHSRYYPKSPAKLDEGVARWVTMAEALSTPAAEVVGFPRRADTDDVVTIDGVEYRARDLRSADLPAQAVTEKARSWQRFGDVVQKNGTVREADQPAPTLTASADNGNFRFVAAAGMTGEGRPRPVEHPAPTITGKGTAYGMAEASEWRAEAAVAGDTSWSGERPSPTIVGSFAPDVVAAPGYRKPGDPPRQKTPGSVRVTVQQAGVLQSFPADYPWQGSKTKQFQQVGNAVPPVLAAAVLAPLLSL